MANIKNLKPIKSLSSEEAKKRGSLGGKKSAEVRRARSTFNKSLVEALEKNGTQEAIVKAIIKEAKKGNIKAFEVIRDTVGEKPRDELNLSGTVNNPYTGLSEEELRKLAGDI